MPWFTCIVSNVVIAALLALLAWHVQRFLRMPAVARFLWVAVLVKLVTPPLVSVPVVELPQSVACVLGLCNCPQHASAQGMVGQVLLGALLAAWLVGAAATAWTAWRRWTQFERLIAQARPAPRGWQLLATRLSIELSIRRPPAILMVPGRLPPMVVPGRGRARLLLPMALLGQLNDSRKESLLLHELAHIKRKDHLVRILELMVSIIFWWLPLISLIGRQLRVCEETCCDASVVARLPHVRRQYAGLLLDVIDFARPLQQISPQATAMSAVSNLEQRLRSILDTTQGRRHSWSVGAITLGLALAVLPCGLRYDFVKPSAPAVPPDTCDPVAPNAQPNDIPFRALCCPS
jgi:bla regulator protein blaR1